MADLAPIQRLAAGGDFTPSEGVDNGRLRRSGNAVPTAGGKRGQGHRMVPLPPLDSPKPSFEPLSEAFAAKRGKRGLGSVRRADFGTLLGPEVSLRDLPRMTVRGQTVQGAGLALRKAPLRSRMIPWSTKRHCGPLVFRRATEGSRVLRKGWGVKRGRETLVSLPLLPPPPGGGTPTPCHGEKPPSREGQSRLRRQAAGTAEGLPSADGKKKKHRLSPVRSGVTQTPFESGSYRPPCRRRWRAGCCASRRAALRSARCTAARERHACRSPSRHS